MQRHISIFAVMLLLLFVLVITATAGAIGCTIGQEPTAIPTPQPASTPDPTPIRLAPTSTHAAVTEPTAISTPQPTSTLDPSPTPTAPTNTPTQEPTYTSTPEPTSTNTPKPTDTATPVPTSTFTFEPTNTLTPLPIDTATPEPTSTNTAVPEPTNTPTPIPTDTPVPTPTVTPTPVTGPCANGVVVPDPQNNLGLFSDCEALLSSRDKLAGDAELNWSADIAITDWDGVSLGGASTRVIAVYLDSYGLTGKIPAELGSLTNLQYLELGLNQFALGLNQFADEILAELESLTNLQYSGLDHNKLTGEIPPELGKLTNLQYLGLGLNELTGEIPPEIWELTSLEYIDLYDNKLTGSILPELRKLSNLKILVLSLNRLTGKLPPELGKLTNLQYLGLGFNELTGEIPSEISELTSLEHLDVRGNYLTGEIPSEIGELIKLKELSLDSNFLTGEIPAEIGKLTKLKELSLYGNELTGPIPSNISNLANLETLRLSNNRLTGTVPVELGRLANLNYYSIANNELEGCIPDVLKLSPQEDKDGTITQGEAPSYYIGNLYFCSEPSRPVFNGGIDLGVAYIERMPRFWRYKYCGNSLRGSMLCSSQNNIKRWPDPSETVELIAHVWNFGDVASGTFDYEWKIDGRPIVKDQHNGLASGDSAEFKFTMQWPDAQSNPVITFTVDPDDEIQELIEDNNFVDDWIKGYTLGIYFSPTVYESLMLSNEKGRTIQSPERWIHNNVEFLNQLFIEAELKDRIRVEQLYITEEEHFITQSLDRYMDGWWRIWHDEDSFYSPEGYERCPEIDLGLLHEWMHQLGVIDTYLMNIDTSEVLLPDANIQGQKAGCGLGYQEWEEGCYILPTELQDIMSGTEYIRIGPHTAGGLRSNYGHRRGHYGEYLYDTPETTIVKILDKRGNPIPDATLRFYQRKWLGEDGPQIEEGSLPIYETYFIGTIPEFEVTTDENGLAVLPNRGVTGPVTATEHQLRPNPFGLIDVVGGNGIFLIEMESSECINYEWLTIVELNLAYWDGQTDEAVFTKTLRCPPP